MAVVKLGKPVKSNLGGDNGAMAYIINPAKTDGGRLVSSNYERTRTDHDALAAAVTERPARAVVKLNLKRTACHQLVQQTAENIFRPDHGRFPTKAIAAAPVLRSSTRPKSSTSDVAKRNCNRGRRGST